MPGAERQIVVVGAGVFGATAALELADRGHAVTLIDRGVAPHPDASSTDVSKMIRMDYGSDVFYHELADSSLDGWRRWNTDWERPLYHPDGFLVLSVDEMRPGGYEFESLRVLRERGFEPERIGGQDLARRFPAWRGDAYSDGYISKPGGWAESGAVVAALLAACQSRGVRFVTGTFVGLSSEGSRVNGVRVRPTSADTGGLSVAGEVGVAGEGGEGGEEREASTVEDAAGFSYDEGPTQAETMPADLVVICAGAWTPELIPDLSGALTVVAQPVLHFAVTDPAAFRPPHFLPFAADISGSGWYGFPALADGRLKLGHHGDGKRVAADARGKVSDDHVAMARAFLRSAIPSAAEAPVVGTRMCLYSDSIDGDLLIDRDPHRDGLVVAAGGSGHAFKFAPLLGGIIADVAEGRDNEWRSRFAWRVDGTRAREQARLNSHQD